MEAQDLHPPIHRINVAQFHHMLEAGVLTEDDRVELIDGEMRDMPPGRGASRHHRPVPFLQARA